MLNQMGAAAELNVCFLGFNENERRLINATVRLSRRRPPGLQELKAEDADKADVIILDDAGIKTHRGMLEASWFPKKVVITVDQHQASHANFTSSLELKRPVQWTNLPLIISKALYKRRAEHEPRDEPTAKQANTEVEKEDSGKAFVNSAAMAAPRQEEKRLLVCDDSNAIRAHLASLLNEKGIETASAACAEEAIDLAKSEQFSCVLMDVVMPGMDGYEACRSIKRENGDTPVVMLTSKSSPFDKIRGKIAGCDAYLTKPTSITKLMNIVSNYVAVKS